MQHRRPQRDRGDRRLCERHDDAHQHLQVAGAVDERRLLVGRVDRHQEVAHDDHEVRLRHQWQDQRPARVEQADAAHQQVARDQSAREEQHQQEVERDPLAARQIPLGQRIGGQQRHGERQTDAQDGAVDRVVVGDAGVAELGEGEPVGAGGPVLVPHPEAERARLVGRRERQHQGRPERIEDGQAVEGEERQVDRVEARLAPAPPAQDPRFQCRGATRGHSRCSGARGR